MRNQVEKILTYFGLNLPIIEDGDFYVEINDFGFPCRLAIPSKDRKLSREQWEIEQATREYCAGWNLGVSYELIALLHEIGHIMYGFGNISDSYEEDVDLLGTMHANGNLTTEQLVDLYNALPDEAHANKWACDWIRNNKDLAKYWDNCLKV